MKTPGDDEDRTRGAHEPGWRTTLEFTLANGPGSERPAAERVMQALQRLIMGDQTRAQLRNALVRAVRYTVRRDEQGGQKLAVRVLIPARAVGKSNAGESAWPAPAEVSGPKSLGWGFFLVHKRAEDRQNPVGELYDVIELYLYQEG
jgi:hypothetical protein